MSISGRVYKQPTTGKWYVSLDLGMVDGKRKRKGVGGGFRTKKLANAELSRVIAEANGGAYRESSEMPLTAYLRDVWLPALHELKPTTREGYRVQVESYVIPHLGDVRLCDLTVGQVTRLYDTLRTTGRKRGRKVEQPDGTTVTVPAGLSESSVHHVHVALTAALGHAVEAEYLKPSDNPMARLPRKARPKMTSQDKAEMQTWSAAEAQQFLAVASTDRLGPLYDLALNTGLRRGELVGLRWADVNLEAGRLAVRRNRTTVGYDVAEGTPKGTRARTIDLDPPTVAMLRSHQRAQKKERWDWKEAWTDTGLVFTQHDGTAIHPQTAAWHLKRLAKAAGVPVIRLHDLRHTHATLGLAAGVPPKVMQERLGHSSIQITLDLYSHVVPGMQADAAARIGALLRG